MRNLYLKIGFLVLSLSLIVSFGVLAPSAAGRGKTILEFDTMTGVAGPYVGSVNPIRGINAGGLPWNIASGHGELQGNGDLEVTVRGLVLASGPNAGTNPIPNFRAIVSCLSFSGDAPTTVNVRTDPFPASTTGDAHIEAHVTLPSPCIAPIVFVTSPAGSWFASTGS